MDALYASAMLVRALRDDGAYPAQIERVLDDAERIVRDTGAILFSPLLLVERAELATDVGEAERLLREAIEMLEKFGAPARAAELRARLEQ